MVLSFPAAELIGNFVACILYGVYLVTSGLAGRALLTTERGRIRRRSEIKWVNLVVAVVFLLNGTFDLILSLSLTFRAFVLYTGPGGAEHVFLDAANWQNLAKVTGLFPVILLCVSHQSRAPPLQCKRSLAMLYWSACHSRFLSS